MSELGCQTAICLLALTTQYYFDERGSVIPMLELAHFSAVAISHFSCGAVCWRTVNGHVAIRTTIANLAHASYRVPYYPEALLLPTEDTTSAIRIQAGSSSSIHGKMHLEPMFYFRLQNLAMSLRVPSIVTRSSKTKRSVLDLIVLRPSRRYLRAVLLCLLQFFISPQVTQRLRQANRA